VPSTPLQFTPPTEGGTPQVPGFVGETADAFGELQTPPQQSVAWKQMSPVCVQYDEAMLHVPFEQSPEQHCALDEHVLPAVVHPPPLPPSALPPPIGAHFPPTHVSVQHVLPALGHGSPSETHWVAPQVPFTHAPVQQSVETLHEAPALAHAPIDDTQTPPRQRLEQQSELAAQTAPEAPHIAGEAPSPVGDDPPSASGPVIAPSAARPPSPSPPPPRSVALPQASGTVPSARRERAASPESQRRSTMGPPSDWQERRPVTWSLQVPAGGENQRDSRTPAVYSRPAPQHAYRPPTARPPECHPATMTGK
jgi:hypothetical protein